MISRMAGLPLAKPAVRMSSTESVTVATSESFTGAAVLVGDHQRLVIRRVHQLIGGAERTSRGWLSATSPLGRLALALAEHRADIFQAQSEIVQQRRIHVHSHGGKGTAADEDLSDALHLRQLLLQDGGRDVVDLALAASYPK